MATIQKDFSGNASANVNVGPGERTISAVGGSVLALMGLARTLRQFPLGGTALALVGGLLAYRGLTGVCRVYEALGIDRSRPEGAVTGNLGIKVERTVTVHAPPDQLFRVWRNLENLPQFMSHLERVEVTGPRRSRWTLKTPVVPAIQWDAEIINEKSNELIAWQSIGHPLVNSAGSVRFEPTADGSGTHVHVSLQYDPPGGRVGHAVAALFGEDAGQQIDRDLQSFKRAMERGERAA